MTTGGESVYQIGEAAEMVGLSLRTIRHWDEVSLVPPSGRSAGGFRLYTDSDVERLKLAKHMKPLGFSLDEMRELLETLDALATRPRPRIRNRLLQQLSNFADLAEVRCEGLREQLSAAEGLAAALKHEVESQPESLRSVGSQKK
jgi:DNA-binding transcriptional MerR regulator